MSNRRTRRRQVRPEPGLEVIDGREVWVVQVEQSLGGDVSAIAEFASVDGEYPVRRSISVVSDFLLPAGDIDAKRLNALNLTKLGEQARTQLDRFKTEHPEWAEAVVALEKSGISRRRGRTRESDDELRRYVDAYSQAQASRPKGKTIYGEMRSLLGYASSDLSQIERDVGYLKGKVRKCRKRHLLPKGKAGRPKAPS